MATLWDRNSHIHITSHISITLGLSVRGLVHSEQHGHGHAPITGQDGHPFEHSFHACILIRFAHLGGTRGRFGCCGTSGGLSGGLLALLRGLFFRGLLRGRCRLAKNVILGNVLADICLDPAVMETHACIP